MSHTTKILWQALRGLEKDLQEVAAASDDLLYGDQDALNLVFRGNRGWLQLDLKWNVQVRQDSKSAVWKDHWHSTATNKEGFIGSVV